jgi:WD40 repeat protein
MWMCLRMGHRAAAPGLSLLALLLLLIGSAWAQDAPKIEIVPIIAHSNPVASVTFSGDGARVLSGSGDGTLRPWDKETRRLLRIFVGHSDRVWSAALSPDGKHALSGSKDKTLKLWDVTTGQLIRTFVGHSGEVKSVAFSPNGIHVVSGSSDKTVKLWDVETGQPLRTCRRGEFGRVLAGRRQDYIEQL